MERNEQIEKLASYDAACSLECLLMSVRMYHHSLVAVATMMRNYLKYCDGLTPSQVEAMTSYQFFYTVSMCDLCITWLYENAQ